MKMAIDDVSFYTLTGEEINRSYLVEQMIDYYGLKLEVGETKVTDFNEGSEIRNLLEAIAVDIYVLMEEENQLTAMCFVSSAEGEYLDMHGANPFINLPREEGSESNGFVTFSTDEPVISETVIPEGTIVANSTNGLEYSTVYDATLNIGDDSVMVAIECLTTGADGNCDVGEIDILSDSFADIPTLTVTNENKITGGTDYEEDEEYRQRLLNYIRKDDFGSLSYYNKLGYEVEGVHDITLIDDPNEVYNKIVLVNGNVKPTPDAVLADVLEKYTNINNIVIGHSFNVDKPNYIEVPLTIDLTVSVEINEEVINTILSEIFDGGGSISPSFEFEGLYMGQNLTGEMIKSNLILLDGVESVSVYKTGDESELEVIETAADEVCKLGTVTINQSISN